MYSALMSSSQHAARSKTAMCGASIFTAGVTSMPSSQPTNNVPARVTAARLLSSHISSVLKVVDLADDFGEMGDRGG